MTTTNCWGDTQAHDYQKLSNDLIRLLKLKTIVVGIKRYRTMEEVQAIPKVRIPAMGKKFNMDQIVGQSRWNGFTIGINAQHLTGSQCSAVVGLTPRDEEFLNGKNFAGYWYENIEGSAKHQQEMACAPYGEYQALAVSPITSGRLGNPDICLIYATPGQMITLINGLQYSGYKKYSFTCVGESACADSWGNALKTGEPSLSIPCYAERKFGGVTDDEMLIALPPSYLPKIVQGLEALNKNGLRYPIPSAGIDTSPLDAFIAVYG